MNNTHSPLPLQERLALAKASQASSPEAAAALVERFSRLDTPKLFAGRADCDLMYELNGEFWDETGDDLFHYSGFCRSIQAALDSDFEPPADPTYRAVPLSPVWGRRVNNALVLLGLMLLDHMKGKRRDKAIFHSTRMKLGQYLDALESLAYRDGEAAPGVYFRTWRADFLKRYDRSDTLVDVLSGILRGYIDAWQEFDHLDHLLLCTGALACYLEDVAGETLEPETAQQVRRFRETLRMYAPDLDCWELIEADRRYPKPDGYYFTLAYEYPDNLPDPGSRELPARAIRTQFYLPREEYQLGLLPLLADLSPSPDLGDLLRKYGDSERLIAAMAEIHLAVSDLYMLFVEPYLRMEQLRTESQALPE